LGSNFAFLGTAGRLPSAFALNFGVSCDAGDGPLLNVDKTSSTGDITRGKDRGLFGLFGLLIPDVDAPPSFDPLPEGPEFELPFLAKAGRLLPADATNFLLAAVTFFFGGDLIAARISSPGVMVLPDEGMSS
jgi:hypothetical protein